MKNKKHKKQAMRINAKYQDNSYTPKKRKTPTPQPQYVNYTDSFHPLTLNGKGAKLTLDAALPKNFGAMSASCGGAFSLFPGYPFLQWISQNALVSAGVETTAGEMCRKFAKVVSTAENDADTSDSTQDDKIKHLEAMLKKHALRKIFREAAKMIGYYGGCLVAINTKDDDDDEVIQTPLTMDAATFPKDYITGFTVIDPINVTPGQYNSINPIAHDYFKPDSWIVMGRKIHKSRVLYFCGKEAPLLYKPAYNFFGVSAAQLVWEYVENFLGNRDSASNLLDKFSLTALKTDMSQILQGNVSSDFESRIRFMVDNASNQGILAIDKEAEDIIKVDTALGGVTDIARQALELIASVFRIPAVKLLGISPSGFNATGESDMRNFYDYIETLQEEQFAHNFERVLQLLQFNEWQELDPHIGAEWEPLGEKDAKLKADTKKVEADTAAVYFDRGLVTQNEVRKALAEDKEGLFASIDVDDDEALGLMDPGLDLDLDDIDDVDKAGEVV